MMLDIYIRDKLKLFVCYIGFSSILLLPFMTFAHEQCITCHLDPDPVEGSVELAGRLPGLCIYCHTERVGRGEHTINVIPRQSTGDLPLVNGRLGCTSCHDPHSTEPKQLWLRGDALCFTCHEF